MIKFCPAYIVANYTSGVFDIRQPQNTLPLYEYFARRALEKDRWRLELLNDTSGINNSQFHGMPDMHCVDTTLAKLFGCVGHYGPHGELLRYCGIKKWRDLETAIALPGWDRRFIFPSNVRERQLKKSWNECHPGAVYGQWAYLRFERDGRWSFNVDYGYSHDGSTWTLQLPQNRRESLVRFNGRVLAWMHNLFGDDLDQHAREQQLRDYDRITKNVYELFCGHFIEYNNKLCDALLHLASAERSRRKLILSKRRLGVLVRWIKEDVKACRLEGTKR